MPGKFAKVRLAKSIDEIELGHILIKKAPLFIQNWYVEKYKPLTIAEIELCGVSGFEIILSCKDDESLLKLAEEAKNLGVRAMFSDDNISLPEGFFVPCGAFVKAFFLGHIIDKFSRAEKIDPSVLNIIIIEGGEYFTKAIIKALYNRLNYLGIIVEKSNTEVYNELALEIFNDCGLNINFGQRGSYLLKEADIIINLSEDKRGYESFYKKRACYVELAPIRDKLNDINGKRSDILAIDKFSVEYGGSILPLSQFELIMYLELSPFYNLINGRNVEESFSQVEYSLERRNIRARNLNF